MKTKFESTKDILYVVFSKYVVEGNLRKRSCECCVSNEEIRLLLSKPLSQLTENELGHFMRSAVTTYGDIEDYKHFLPRILELIYCSENDLLSDFIIFEKLNYSEWETWPLSEVEAIENFITNLLVNTIEETSYNFDRLVDTINLAFKYTNTKNVFSILENSNSLHLVNFIVDSTLNGIDNTLCKSIEDWFTSDNVLMKLERAFFKVKDKDLATRISIVYTILENFN